MTHPLAQPQTEAVRRALQRTHDDASVRDLLFLEAWECQAAPDIAAALRASQLRRANPRLVEEIRAELRGARAAVSSLPQ